MSSRAWCIRLSKVSEIHVYSQIILDIYQWKYFIQYENYCNPMIDKKMIMVIRLKLLLKVLKMHFDILLSAVVSIIVILKIVTLQYRFVCFRFQTFCFGNLYSTTSKQNSTINIYSFLILWSNISRIFVAVYFSTRWSMRMKASFAASQFQIFF